MTENLINKKFNSNYCYFEKNSFEIVLKNNSKIKKIDSFICKVNDFSVETSDKSHFFTINFDIRINLYFLDDEKLYSLKEKNIVMHDFEFNTSNKSIKKNVNIYETVSNVINETNVLVKIYFFIALTKTEDECLAFISKEKNNRVTLNITNHSFRSFKRFNLANVNNYYKLKFKETPYELLYLKNLSINSNYLCEYNIFQKKEFIISYKFSNIDSFKYLNNKIIIQGMRDFNYGLYLINRKEEKDFLFYVNKGIKDFIFLDNNYIAVSIKKIGFFEIKIIDLFYFNEVKSFKIKCCDCFILDQDNIIFFLENGVLNINNLDNSFIETIILEEHISSIIKVLKINCDLFLILTKTINKEIFLFIYSIKNKEKFILLKKSVNIYSIDIDRKKQFLYLTINYKDKYSFFTMNLNNYSSKNIFNITCKDLTLSVY